MAASTTFVATVTGKGGHAAQPQLLRDPVVAAAAIVSSLQTLAAREVDPATDGVVVSVTKFQTPDGGALNVMPDEVHLGGTIRALNNPTFQYMQERVYAVIRGQAEQYRCARSPSLSSSKWARLLPMT